LVRTAGKLPKSTSLYVSMFEVSPLCFDRPPLSETITRGRVLSIEIPRCFLLHNSFFLPLRVLWLVSHLSFAETFARAIVSRDLIFLIWKGFPFFELSLLQCIAEPLLAPSVEVFFPLFLLSRFVSFCIFLQFWVTRDSPANMISSSSRLGSLRLDLLFFTSSP